MLTFLMLTIGCSTENPLCTDNYCVEGEIYPRAWLDSNEPQVPVHRLMGKSPEYIAVYTDEYHRAARHKQLGLSLGGCVFGSIAFIALSLISPSN